MKIIAIFGSRLRDSDMTYEKMKAKFLSLYEPGDRIVSGGCYKGADRFAEKIAKLFEIPIMIHYARWKANGKAAGFMRNTDIANDATIGITMPAEDRKGGTEDTIKKMQKLGKKVYFV